MCPGGGGGSGPRNCNHHNSFYENTLKTLNKKHNRVKENCEIPPKIKISSWHTMNIRITSPQYILMTLPQCILMTLPIIMMHYNNLIKIISHGSLMLPFNSTCQLDHNKFILIISHIDVVGTNKET